MNKEARKHVEKMRAIAAEHGATIDRVSINGHIHLHVTLSDGRPIKFAICSTPSDHRSRLNDQSDFRRRLRERRA